MTQQQILRTESEGIIELVFNRPEKLNALTVGMFGTVREAVEDLRTRPDLRVLLIRSQGRYFSAGADLTEGQAPASRDPSEVRNWMRRELGAGMHSLYEEMERVEKPIVIAHHAPCVGGGLEMSLSCDFRLAARSAAYSFPEMKFGMLPLSGGISRLTRICGAHWARWLVLGSQTVTAERALIMGLVHDVYPDETFEEEVRKFCVALARQPAEATAAAKLAIELVNDLPADQSRQVDRLVFSLLQSTAEHSELSVKHRAKLTR